MIRQWGQHCAGMEYCYTGSNGKIPRVRLWQEDWNLYQDEI